MSYQSNRSILEKAEFALSHLVTNGGLLLPAQAQKFMRLSIEEAVLLGQVTYRPMNRAREEIDQIKFGSRVLRAAQELTALPVADQVVPDISKVELDAQEFIGEVTISDQALTFAPLARAKLTSDRRGKSPAVPENGRSKFQTAGCQGV